MRSNGTAAHFPDQSWFRTLFYRRLRKKGTQEDQLKKAKKRTIISTAATRGIQGLSIQDLAAKTDDKKKAAVKEAFTRFLLNPNVPLGRSTELRTVLERSPNGANFGIFD